MTHHPADCSLAAAWSDDSVDRVSADLLVLPAQPSTPAYRDAGLSGRVGEDLLAVVDGRLVLWVGLGPEDTRDHDVVRRAARRVGRAHGHLARLATTLHQGVPGGATAVVEGLAEGRYRFDRYRTLGSEPRVGRGDVVLLREAGTPSSARTGIAHEPELAESVALAEEVRWVRDLVNTPSGDLTPQGLAELARTELGRDGVDVALHAGEDLTRLGCGGLIAVGQGSHHPPVLVEARWAGPGPVTREVHLVGKGITFDSGGLCIKGGAAMVEMKSDMAGGAVVLAALRAVARAGVPGLAVTAWVPAAENMPGGGAVRPGDVLRHPNGVTSEVADTDCEGRLVMADALALAAARAPTALIDVATLTYACVTAVGDKITVALGNDDALMDAAVRAGAAVGEPIWRLPLWQPYLPLVASEIADVRNEGKDGSPGCITSALFLQHFVGEIPWLHLDVGGTAWIDEADAEWAAGGTGAMVRTLVRLLSHPEPSAPEGDSR